MRLYVFMSLIIMAGATPARLAAQAIPSGRSSRVVFELQIVDESPPNRPWAKLAGDLDRDGKVDIVIAGANGPVVWYKSPMWTKAVLADGGWDGVRGTIADINGDGWPDIVLGGLVWLENPKDEPGRWPSHLIEKRRLHDVLAVDLDGDGKLEIIGRDQSAFGNKTGDAVYLYRKQTGENWDRLVLPCDHGEGIAAGDLTGDCLPEVVIGPQYFENPGKWQPGWTRRAITGAWTHPHNKVELADLNGDERLDVVLAPAELAGQVYKIAWFAAPRLPDRAWQEHVVVDRIEAVIHSLVAADFDGDGAVDLAYAEMHQGQDPDEVVVLLNRGQGKNWHKHVLSARGSHDLLAVDVNGDGAVDLLGANHGGPYQAVELFLNRTTLTKTDIGSLLQKDR
ncbi:MAG: VCBS repeat-containing protein [Thermoguttaceae bacterium]|nr:VCBS repeat-containing protein [Thermoguttaceae bacterium]MDW8078312.1 VCBS repeat-containing protein [Thermoguttaceae bacterium]